MALEGKRPVDTLLPAVTPSRYPESSTDDFTVDYRRVLNAMQDKKTVIIDVRPADYYTGKKSDEAGRPYPGGGEPSFFRRRGED